MSIRVRTVRCYNGPDDRSVWITLTVAGETMFASQICPRERGQETNRADLARAVADIYGIAVTVTVHEIADKALRLSD